MAHYSAIVITLAEEYSHDTSGDVDMSGVITKQTDKITYGGLIFSGILDTLKAFFCSLTASLSFAGNIVKKTYRNLYASMITYGTISKLTIRIVNGAIGFIGNITKIPDKVLSAILGSSGSISHAVYKVKELIAALGFSSGSLVRNINKELTGIVTFYSVYTKLIQKYMLSVFNPSGNVYKKTYRLLQSALSFIGNITSEFLELHYKILNGIVGFSGIISKTPNKILFGVLSINGVQGLVLTIGRILGFQNPIVKFLLRKAGIDLTKRESSAKFRMR
jgi:hypothetical protein